MSFLRRLLSVYTLPDYFPAEWLDEFSRPLYVGLLCGPKYEEPWHDPAYERALIKEVEGDEIEVCNASSVYFPPATCDWGKALLYGIYTSQTGTGVITVGSLTNPMQVCVSGTVGFVGGAMWFDETVAPLILDYLNEVP